MESIVNATAKWPKSLPKVTDKAVARLLGDAMVTMSFIHRSEKVEDKKGYLQVRERVRVFPQ